MPTCPTHSWKCMLDKVAQASEDDEKREKTLPLVAAQNRRSVFTATYRAAAKGSGAVCDFFSKLLGLGSAPGGADVLVGRTAWRLLLQGCRFASRREVGSVQRHLRLSEHQRSLLLALLTAFQKAAAQ